MKATDLRSFKIFLLEQKSSILNKTNEFKSEQAHGRMPPSDESEAISQDLSLNVSIRLHERDRSALFQVERALAKLEEGTFGDCETCGESIGMKRLQARPFATLCVPCKEDQEDPRNYMN